MLKSRREPPSKGAADIGNNLPGAVVALGHTSAAAEDHHSLVAQWEAADKAARRRWHHHRTALAAVGRIPFEAGAGLGRRPPEGARRNRWNPAA